VPATTVSVAGERARSVYSASMRGWFSPELSNGERKYLVVTKV